MSKRLFLNGLTTNNRGGKVLIEIADTPNQIVLTKKDYPSLPFNSVTIRNPKEFKNKIGLYHQLMAEAYHKKLFKSQNETS